MHGKSYTLIGKAMRDSAEKVQMGIGMGTPFVQITFNKLGTWTTKTRLNMMRKNLGSLEIKLLRLDLPSLLMQREGDTCIMADFAGLYDMDKRTMRRLNQICLSMEIYTMSDLATGNVLSIRKDMVASCTPGKEENSQYECPQE